MKFSNLILGRGPCPRATVEIGVNTPQPRLQGIISWELTRRGIIINSGEVQNLITDVGMDSMVTVTPANSTVWCAVGTGSTAPAFAQTALVAEIGRVQRTDTGDNAITSGPAFAYWSFKKVKLFLETEANGNLTEVGFFNQSSGGTMFSRQLFKDLVGTPTTVVKTSADQLKVTYEVRAYPPTVDVFQSGLVISGTSYDFQTRARLINNISVWGIYVGNGLTTSPGGRAFESSAALGSTSSTLSGANTARDTAVYSSYTAGTFFRDITYKWEPSTANLAGGIGGFSTFGGDTIELFQSKVTPSFAKDATKRLTLVARLAWARYP
jgi:hypothetical protein